jgi:hypothetical protein
MMKRISLLNNIRVSYLILLLIGIFQICTAPTNDFGSKYSRIRSIMDEVHLKYHESEYKRFIKELGYRESANNWLCINRIGCFGEWQFAESTLHCLGFKQVTLRKFRNDPEIFPPDLQLKALESLIKVNLCLLKDYEHFIGDTIRGIVITKSGMIAAAHLGGANNLKKFLVSRGKINKKDILGTSLYHYLRRFQYYDLG